MFFLSDFSLHEHYEQGYNRNIEWDIPLNNGYAWKVVPRRFIGSSTALRPCWPVARLREHLVNGVFDAVWIHGWGHVGLCQAIHTATALQLPVLLRGDSTLERDPLPKVRGSFRNIVYRYLFSFPAGFLSIGTRNLEFYRQYQVPEEKLFSVPYAVDNEFFYAGCVDAAQRRESLRGLLGLQRGRPVILFVGRLASEKAPDELLDAFHHVYNQLSGPTAPYLLFVGDGPFRPALEEKARSFVDAVRFLGFRNQSELPALYDLCDVFVLPSRFEPWGLVVNEVMNAGRPVILSDRVGAGPDLVKNGDNGFIYSSGDVYALASRLRQVLESPGVRAKMGERSLKRISSWDFEADRRGLLEALSKVCSQRRAAAVRG